MKSSIRKSLLFAKHERLFMAMLTCALLVSACDAQKTSVGASAFAKGQRYAEPALLGRVIDMETKQPIKGAFVYGHYATSSGTLAGGTKFGELVKSFSAETDDNGYFKLDAWDTGNRSVQASGAASFRQSLFTNRDMR